MGIEGIANIDFSQMSQEQRAAYRQALREQRSRERRETQSVRGTVQHQSKKVTESQPQKRSQTIPAAWRLKGLKIGGLIIRKGFFYFGCNTETMPASYIAEPSLIDPTEEIDFAYDGRLQSLPIYPCYSYMGPAQRAKYLRFLASNRCSADIDDMGYVFLYLYGIERRLVIDSRVDELVDDDERVALTKEVLRLIGEFKHRSRSFYHYATALLLFDGRMFEGGWTTADIVSTFFDSSATKRFDPIRTSDFDDGKDAYQFMLLSRLFQIGVRFPEEDMLNYAFLRLSRNNMMQYDLSRLSDDDVRASARLLLKTRYRNSGIYLPEGWPADKENAKGRGKLAAKIPQYVPSSPSLRKQTSIRSIEAKMPNIEQLKVPFRQLSDMAVTAIRDVCEYIDLLGNASLRGITKVAPDTIVAVSPPRVLYKHFGNSVLSIIPPDVLTKQFESSFGRKPQENSTGMLSADTRLGYAALLSALGWQGVAADLIEGEKLATSWKLSTKLPMVAFRREFLHSQANGSKTIAPIFSQDEAGSVLDIPCTEVPKLASAWFFGWFISNLGAEIDESSLALFPKTLYVEPSGKIARRLSVAYMIAGNSYEATNSQLGVCLSEARFSDIQEIMFNWCAARYGVVIPQDVVSLMEKVYTRSGVDKAMVLYDYRAGEYRISRNTANRDESFSIDSDKLHTMIAETSNVHDLLGDAMGADDDMVVEDDATAVSLIDIGDDNAVREESLEQEKTSVNEEEMFSAIRSFFGDSDEMPTESLREAVSSYISAKTSAEAMAWIANANELYENIHGDVIVEIDGADSYLN